VAEEFVVPSPSRETAAYVRAVAEILERGRVDLLVPTCEEALFLAPHRRRLGERCRLLLDDFDKLLTLHDKSRFAALMAALGLPVPRTTRLTSREDLRRALSNGHASEVVLKPAFSRFAAHTVHRPRRASEVSGVRPTPAEPWIAQSYVEGRGVSTYAIAHDGRLTAHVAYPIELALDRGPTVAYTPIRHDEALRITAAVAAALSYTGQLGIDFIESRDGTAWAIECSPRTAGGVHCFDGTPGFREALLGAREGVLFPARPGTRVLRLALLSCLPLGRRSPGSLRAWLRAMIRGREVIRRPDDRWPAVQQWVAMRHYWRLARRTGLGLRDATTWDLAFDGRCVED